MAREDSRTVVRGQLPSEIWIRIFSFLAEPPDKPWLFDEPLIPYSTLTSLCLTSKFIQSLAEPLLYESFSTDRDIMLHEFTNVVLRSPRLWSYVRNLHVSLDWTEDSYTKPLSTGDLAPFKAISKTYGITQLSEGAEDLEKLNDMFIKILCLILPNLRKLSLSVGTDIALGKILENEDDARIVAPNLRELYLVDKEPEIYGLNTGTDLIHYAGLFDCPKLESIRFEAFDSICQNDEEDRVLCVYKHVKSLHFVKSVLSGDDILDIAKSFPNIEDFEYQYGPINEEQAKGFKGIELKQALNQWTGTLRRLSLDFSFFIEDGRGDRKDDFIEDWSGFKRLEELELESLFVLRERHEKHEDGSHTCEAENADLWKDYLPLTLKRLRVNRTYRNIEEPLKTLAHNVREWAPSLEVIHISLGHFEGTPGYADFDVPEGTQMDDLFEPIMTDRSLSIQLCRNLPKVEKNFFYTKTAQLYLPTSYCKENGHEAGFRKFVSENLSIACLPELWQDLIDKFNAAGVRVMISNQTYDRTDFDDADQMAKISWITCAKHRRTMY